jgi:hypothetical protein
MIEGYLAHKKQHPPSNLQWEYAQSPMVVQVGVAASNEPGTFVEKRSMWPGSRSRGRRETVTSTGVTRN